MSLKRANSCLQLSVHAICVVLIVIPVVAKGTMVYSRRLSGKSSRAVFRQGSLNCTTSFESGWRSR